MSRSLSTGVVFVLMILLIPVLAHAQRGGRGGGGRAMAGRGAVRVSDGRAVQATDRRTDVIAGARENGRVDDRLRRNRRHDINDGRPGIGGGVAHPGLAAAAIARRVPIGTVIVELPADCAMMFVMGLEHYYCSGQYYQPMGTGTDQIYVAVEPYIPEY